MTEWDRLHRRAQMIKDRYPAGTRVMLLHMGSDPRPVEPNSKGTEEPLCKTIHTPRISQARST